MNKYLSKIIKAVNNTTRQQNKMKAFSRKVQKAMQLDYDNLVDAKDKDIMWDIGDFTIGCRSFPWNNWDILLLAVPKGDNPAKVGYSNTAKLSASSWYCKPDGTATIIVPPDCIQEKILEQIIRNTRTNKE